MKLQEIGSEDALRKLFTENHLVFQDSEGDVTGKKGDLNFVFNDKKNLIIGPNGGGKTRFLKMIYQYYTEVLNYSIYSIAHIDFPDFERNEKKMSEDNNPPEFEADLLILFENKFDGSWEKVFYKIANETDNLFKSILNRTQRRSNGTYKDKFDNLLKVLNNFLKELLSIELKVVGEGKYSELHWTHYGKIIAKVSESENGLSEYLKLMSPGEKNLFYIVILFCCISYFSPEKELVILFDEPELHLHTEKTKKFIRLFQDEIVTKKVTFWIATHSIQLLSDFRYSEIILLNNGALQPRGSNYFKSIYEVMQGTDAGIKLLLADIENWEYYNFVQECFERPKTVLDHNKQDPQWLALMKIISQVYVQNTDIKILDYGSGQGRFGYYCDDQDQMVYYTFDEYLEQPEYSKEHFKSEDELRDSGIKFNCVLLVNTLHEIDISKWVAVFRSIENALDDNGFMFFCEAALLPEGEFPYDNCGYLILGKEEIQALFEETVSVIVDYKKIFAAAISKEQLKKFVESEKEDQVKRLLEAIQSLEKYSWKKIEEIDNVRKKQLNIQEELDSKKSLDNHECRYKKSAITRKYGFYALQYIHALKAGKTLSGSIKSQRHTEEEKKQKSKKIFIKNEFENIVNAEIKKISLRQQVFFAWLCAVRVLPILFISANTRFWKKEKIQKYIYDVFYALDIACYYYSITAEGMLVSIAIANNVAANATEASEAASIAATAALSTATAALNAAIAAASVTTNDNVTTIGTTNVISANAIPTDAVRTANITLKAAKAAADVVETAAKAAATAAYAANTASAAKVFIASATISINVADNVATQAAKAANSARITAKTAYQTAIATEAWSLKKIESKRFRAIIVDDLKFIKADDNDSLNNSTTAYGNIWDNFEKTLITLGCEYWLRLYQELFSKKFEINFIELERRMKVPEKIREQGAAAVGKYLSESLEKP